MGREIFASRVDDCSFSFPPFQFLTPLVFSHFVLVFFFVCIFVRFSLSSLFFFRFRFSQCQYLFALIIDFKFSKIRLQCILRYLISSVDQIDLDSSNGKS